MKRNVSDLMGHIHNPDVELEMNTPLSSQRIKELTMNKIEKKNKPGRLGIRVLMAAAVIVIMAMTVFAAENILTYDNWLAEYFSDKEVIAEISENQLALLDQSIAKVNQSVTSNGYTVTLETAITDGYVAYITFRVDAPEDVVLDGIHYNFEEIPMDMFGESIDNGQVSLRSGGWEMLDDGDPSDNSIRLLLRLNTNSPDDYTAPLTNGEERTIIVNTLKEFFSAEVPPEVVVEGEWSFAFSFADTSGLTEEVEMLPESVRCTGRRQLRQTFTDVTVKVTSFRLRALTGVLVFEEPLTGFWEGITLNPIHVVLKDGTRIKANFEFGGTREESYEYTFGFDVPISFADVDYVEFAGGDKAYMPQ